MRSSNNSSAELRNSFSTASTNYHIIPDRKLETDMCKPSDLSLLKGHARKLSKLHVERVAASIETLGWVAPIIVDESNNVIAGAARLAAAKLLKLKEVPTVRASGMTDAEKRAYRLAENRLAEVGGWDDEALKLEFEQLFAAPIDVSLTGFTDSDIDALFRVAGDDVDGLEPEASQAVVSRSGDLWHIGPHRLLCGSALDPLSFKILMQGAMAQMVFTDPPYNIPIGGHAAGIREAAHEEFAMASGEMSDAEFEEFLIKSLTTLEGVAAAGAILFVCIDWRHARHLLNAAAFVGLEHKQLCVWGKTNAGMGSFYRSQHELVFVLKKPGALHINNFGLAGRGRQRSNLWTYAGANGFRPGREEDLSIHPTVKPLEMVMDAIKDCSKRSGVILDPFVGSGTTLIAAARQGRIGYGIEIKPRFVDTAVRRLMKETGEPAKLANGRAFNDVAAERSKGDQS